MRQPHFRRVIQRSISRCLGTGHLKSLDQGGIHNNMSNVHVDYISLHSINQVLCLDVVNRVDLVDFLYWLVMLALYVDSA